MVTTLTQMDEGRSISSICPGIGYPTDLVSRIIDDKAIDFQPFWSVPNFIWVGGLQKERVEEGEREMRCSKFS